MSMSEFMGARSNAWARAWMNTPGSQRAYQNNVFGYARCKADAENPDCDDHKLATELWMLYIQERVAG